MATATADIIGESELVDTGAKKEKTVTYRVTGLSGTAGAREQEALNACPAYNAAHPSISYLYVRERRARADGPTMAVVTIKYETPTPGGGGGSSSDPTLPTYKAGGSLRQEKTAYDWNGDPITVTYNGVERVAEVTVDIPEADLTITRQESGIVPGDIIDAYLNRVNSVAWNGDPGTWYCSYIGAESRDGGTTWDMTYSFIRPAPAIQGLPATYAMATFQDDNGEVPPGVALPNPLPDYDYNVQWTGTGTTAAPIRGLADFNLLGL